MPRASPRGANFLERCKAEVQLLRIYLPRTRSFHKINGHSLTSRRRPLQMTVEFSELQSEGLPLLEIAFGELHQIIQPATLMVAAHRLMHRPPHQLHQVALRTP